MHVHRHLPKNRAVALAAEDLQSIPLSKFQNFWSDIYDFNDAPGNWTFLPQVLALRMLEEPLHP